MKATARLWDRAAPLNVYIAAKQAFLRALEQIDVSPAFSEQTHIILKESFPFEFPHGRRTPDMWDILDASEDARFVAIYREPCASTYSALRRNFDDDLKRLAASCAESLTWIAGQVHALGRKRVRIVSYEALCREPEETLMSVAEFCGISSQALMEAVRSERPETDTDRRYASELAPAETKWLEGFFNDRRRRQWDILAKS